MRMAKAGQWLKLPMMCAGTVLLLLRFVHPYADFPNGSRWSDDAGRYTDEGWYAAAAIHKTLLGHWLVRGDFNPAVLIPGWPAMLTLLFHFTGVSIPAARLLDGAFAIPLILLATMLIRRHEAPYAAAGYLLLCASPILFFFSRLALLETPMLAFFIGAIFAGPRATGRAVARTIACAFLFSCAVLVKTSAIFLLPALLAYLWAENREQGKSRALRRISAVILLLGLSLASYAALAVLPHLADARVLGEQNGMTLQWRSFEKLIRLIYRGVTWVDPVLFPVAMIAIVTACAALQSMARHPLFLLSAWWITGYAAFMVLHFSADPRYFVVFVVPVVFLTLTLLARLQRTYRVPSWSVVVLVLIAFGLDAVEIARHMLRPTYGMRDAYLAMDSTIRMEDKSRSLVFGHGALQSTLFTHIEAIDNMGSMPLGKKLDTYHPGWVVTWSDGSGIVNNPEVVARFKTVPKGTWAVMDQPGRSHLLLFRLQARDQVLPLPAR